MRRNKISERLERFGIEILRRNKIPRPTKIIQRHRWRRRTGPREGDRRCSSRLELATAGTGAAGTGARPRPGTTPGGNPGAGAGAGGNPGGGGGLIMS